jgi:NADP-dependent aldehyde dehydrogenase
MALTGENLIAGGRSAAGPAGLHGLDPTSGERLEPGFHEATEGEISLALEGAEAAAAETAAVEAEQRADFLEAIAAEIEALGDELIERTAAETGLPAGRLAGERGRTTGQLRLFAEVVREGSWVEARIDRADPERKPLPKPDVRRMLVPLGPVVVFGASNFPLAFSVAGGDTAAALAAGCPVVVKAHPAHPGASELVGAAIERAAASSGLPPGVFSMVQGAAHAVGTALVTHPATRAVAFTGSLAGGRALFDLAARRPVPIPVYAEMGSANPVFLLPGALAARGEEIAAGLTASVQQGAGQFCTNPGLTVLPAGAHADRLLERAAALLGGSPAGTMVHPGIAASYRRALEEVTELPGVEVLARSEATGPWADTDARPALLETGVGEWLANPRLGEEIYGPTTLAVVCGDGDEMLAVARGLTGHLTATVHGTEDDLAEHGELLAVLATKVGRLILNGYPTGVEVCHAMQHGGPYPATTDSRSTSVGTAAIHRFARPVCWQDFPGAALPAELRDGNPRGIWRLVNGKPSRQGW